MRIYANQLTGDLKKSLHAVYMVMGDEPFQVQQAANDIKRTAKAQGFAEHIKFVASAQFDWQELLQEYASFSLFSEKKLIEIDLAESKPNAAASKLLVELTQQINPDVILLFKGQKNGTDIQRTAWFKALDKHGLFIPCYQLQGRHLHTWLNQQCQQLGIHLAPDAQALLLESNQGNLFAIHQELEKLSLIFSNQPISLEMIAPTLLNQSRFDIFDLSDAILVGNSHKICDIMAKLQQENIESTVISWAILREANSLYSMSLQLATGMPINQVMQQAKVWKNKQAMTQAALQRLSNSQLEHIISALGQFDTQYKQHQLTTPHNVLLHICLLFVAPITFQLPIFNEVL